MRGLVLIIAYDVSEVLNIENDITGRLVGVDWIFPNAGRLRVSKLENRVLLCAGVWEVHPDWMSFV